MLPALYIRLIGAENSAALLVPHGVRDPLYARTKFRFSLLFWPARRSWKPLAVRANEPSSFWLSLPRSSVSEPPLTENVPWKLLGLPALLASQTNEPSALRLRRICVPLLIVAENSPVGAACGAALTG